VFDAAISDNQYAQWTPPGELWQSIETGGQTYEIWKGNLADLAVQQMVKRIQIMVPFFIEGGTFIDLTEPEWSLERWTVFFLYQKSDIIKPLSPYVFMGYSTVYRYFYYQRSEISNSPLAKRQRIERPADLDFSFPLSEVGFQTLPCRSRISQFVILPPFQGGGNGSRFYNAIFDFYLQEISTIEITVEDPNEAFDDLRDLNDLARLRKEPDFKVLRINTKATPRRNGPVPSDIVDRGAIEKLRKRMKIAQRQFLRVTEMHFLSLIPIGVRQSLLVEKPKASGPELKAQEHGYHLWQLWVKTRLYKHNKDMLIQLDRAERIEKLEQALGGVEADYARLLRAMDSRSNGDANGKGGSSSGKRPSPSDEDEEPAAKKVKFAA
jgi:histone acetyltransferase 1